MIAKTTSFFKWFIKQETSAGIVLVFMTVIALIVSNSVLSDTYFSILKTYIPLGFGEFKLKLSVFHWINDALMAIFFLVVGLEIKREFVEGELSRPKQAALPILGAVGGMLVPALVYVAFNYETPETLRGWAIPSATDIAFSIGILSLLGSRVPLSLKVFLTKEEKNVNGNGVTQVISSKLIMQVFRDFDCLWGISNFKIHQN